MTEVFIVYSSFFTDFRNCSNNLLEIMMCSLTWRKFSNPCNQS